MCVCVCVVSGQVMSIVAWENLPAVESSLSVWSFCGYSTSIVALV